MCKINKPITAYIYPILYLRAHLESMCVHFKSIYVCSYAAIPHLSRIAQM